MNFDIQHELKGLEKVAKHFVSRLDKNGALLDDATLQIGYGGAGKYGIPAGAKYSPEWVGDAHWMGDTEPNPKAAAAYKKDPASVGVRWKWNAGKGKYDADFVADGLTDMQTIAPWNASWFNELFRQPLLYSHASKLVRRMSGDNPWAEVMSLQTAVYSGWGALNTAGGVAANAKQNVGVQAGMLTAPIINMKVYFNYTLEEMQRAQWNNNPFAGQLMAEKQRYAQYVLDMMTDYLLYFGNQSAGVEGLLDVNGLTTWAGDSLKDIATGASTNKGSDMYKAVADVITGFMGDAQNKFDTVRVAMSPKAYNYLTSVAYSDAYNPASALAVFAENFRAGVNESGNKPTIKFYSDPFLAADKAGSNPFNTSGDLLVVTAPSVGAGTDNDKQDLLFAGVPVEDFVYPVYPNGYDQQHCLLRRFAGVFAPVPACVKVYSGFAE